MEQFIPLYDWVLAQKDLSLLEACIICRVLRWGESGCFESNSTLAKLLKTSTRSVQRAVKELVRKQWLAVLYTEKQHRILYVDPKRLTAGPLYEQLGYQDVIKTEKNL